MAELLKDMYNKKTINEFALSIKSAYPKFQTEDFSNDVFDHEWNDLELKGRMKKVTATLGKYLPKDYEESIHILNKIAHEHSGFFAIIFPDFVETFGQDEKYLDLSIESLKRYTPYSSSEFAVRPFIINHEERMLKEMLLWSTDQDEHVRRLASEGIRPSLPWAIALPKYKKDPTPILPILENLKNDESLYVRKSVANNLNDISKTHPELVINIAKRWYGQSKHTDWIVKHALRTLLKRANKDALEIFGYHDSSMINVNDFNITKDKISIGDNLEFSFNISSSMDTKVRLEYSIDFVKKNNKMSNKVFQISESNIKKNETKHYDKIHSFKDLSTRTHYPGIHSISLIVNGVEKEKKSFEVKEK